MAVCTPNIYFGLKIRCKNTSLYRRAALVQKNAQYGQPDSASEGLGLGREVVAIGFKGLFGAVNTENVDEAMAANFGDTKAKRETQTAGEIASEVQSAIAAIGTDQAWTQRYLEEILQQSEWHRILRRLSKKSDTMMESMARET